MYIRSAYAPKDNDSDHLHIPLFVDTGVCCNQLDTGLCSSLLLSSEEVDVYR